MKTQKGFTLIELMIVVVIIGILSAVVVPAYSDYVLKGKLAEAFSQLSALQLRMEQYYQDNRSYADGAACGIISAATPNFSYSCTMSDTQHFTYTATGAGGAVGFTYTINEAGTKATTAAPVGWGPTNTGCWVRAKGGAC